MVGRRRNPRYVAGFPAEVFHPGSSTSVQGTIRNIGEGGLLIITEAPAAFGHVARFSVLLNEWRCIALGRVIRVVPTTPPEYAIEFAHIDQPMQNFLHEIAMSEREGGAPEPSVVRVEFSGPPEE